MVPLPWIFGRDGGIDLVLANTSGNDINQIFLNENERGNWIQVELEGTVSNRNGIGSMIYLYTDTLTLMDEMTAGTGYCSQNMAARHFGFGELTVVDSLEVIWPTGVSETYYDLGINTSFLVIEGQGIQELSFDQIEEEEEQEEGEGEEEEGEGEEEEEQEEEEGRR